MKIYLAGFDVFKPNAVEVFAALKSEAELLGLTALSPLDNELPSQSNSSRREVAQTLYGRNIKMLEAADAVIANLCPFRGAEPDCGTIFEVGFAIARGRPVVGYGLPAMSYAEQIARTKDCSRRADGVLVDEDGLLIEDFGLQVNLMIACSVTTFAPTAQEALLAVREVMNAQCAVRVEHDGTAR